MKTIPWTLAMAALSGAALVSTSRASSFVGSSANITDFAAGSQVSTNGVLIDAINLLNDNVGGVGVSTTINGVLFKGTQPGQYHEGAESFANASFAYNGGDNYADGGLWTSGGAYNTLADSQIYGGGMSIGVINLVPGQLYELQAFMLDDRSGINKTFPLHFQQASFTGNNDQNTADPNAIGSISGITIGGNGTTQADGEIATIRFSIDGGFNGLLVRSTSGDAAINGLQLRQVVPEPTGLTLLGMAVASWALRTRRR